MEGKRIERVAAWMLTLLLGGVFVFLFFRYFFGILLPFLIAWGVSFPITSLADRVAERFHLSKRLCAAILFLLFLAVAVCLAVLGINRLVNETRELLLRMVESYGSVEEMVGVWLGELERALSSIRLFGQGGAGGTPLRAKLYEMLYGLLSSAVSAVVGALPSVLGGILQTLPSLLFATVITILAGFYFCMDREHILQSVVAILPCRIREKLPQWRRRSRHASWRYFRAYLILMLITFLILLVGFLVLDVPYALLLAILSAIVDMLPVLGVGTILFPWAAVLLLQRKFYLGFGLLILYAVCTLVRQITEPKLIGKSLGLHPLLTVFATYVGFQLFGVIGMLLSPLFALVAKSVYLQLSDTVGKDD